MSFFFLFSLLSLSLWAKPYFDPTQVISPAVSYERSAAPQSVARQTGSNVLRVEVNWNANETYEVAGLFLERSGTEALLKSSLKEDAFGSYKAQLVVITANGTRTFHASLGTGREFRRLVRTLAFRFPFVADAYSMKLILTAEHPETGKMERVLNLPIRVADIKDVPDQDIRVTLLKKATTPGALRFNFYAEGFFADGEEKFLAAAEKAMRSLEKNIPGADQFEYRAIFSVSKNKIGKAQDFGDEVKIRDSFLGLYFPHWRKFGRWYHVVYPTSVTRYRNALAQEPYDYPLALVDSNEYWGVGNYKELTAIPVGNAQFTYLLLHEFGHFMGLNEEYEGGGPTELEFAPGIKEPWSQNITFNTTELKWQHLTASGIKIPTTYMEYLRFGGSLKNPVGAFPGGYADSEPKKKSHKPVMKCMMGSGGDFCPVCQDGLKSVITHDLGHNRL